MAAHIKRCFVLMSWARMPTPNNPNGSQVKQTRADHGLNAPAMADVAVIVSVELAEASPGVTEGCENEQDGVGEGPVTEHES